MQLTKPVPDVTYTAIDHAVLSVLAYFDLFHHPLTAGEIVHFAACPGATETDICDRLTELTELGVLFETDGYFQSENKPERLAERLENARRADAALPVAARMSQFITSFPFVRAVMVSGSLSKHVLKADGDVDFFVVTTPGRLWLARTLLVLYKKVFLLNSRKFFCVNYFIDTDHLAIEERNLFTATETVTLLPMAGRSWYDQFVAHNQWAWQQFYPAYPVNNTEQVPEAVPGPLKKALEWLLGGWLGDLLDQWFMQGTVRFWRWKFRDFDTSKFEVALKSRRHVSKHHPLHFQQRVLEGHRDKLRNLLSRITH